ncbi:16833_t:CDS:2, partial [Gigaspora rosea]
MTQSEIAGDIAKIKATEEPRVFIENLHTHKPILYDHTSISNLSDHQHNSGFLICGRTDLQGDKDVMNQFYAWTVNAKYLICTAVPLEHKSSKTDGEKFVQVETEFLQKIW